MGTFSIMGAIGFFLAALGSPVADLGWSLINGRVHREFADVPRMSTSELAEKLKQPNPPLLLDVRTEREFAVSHLRGSTRIDPEADGSAVTAAKDREIVTYCSVGYRSAKFAQRLRRAGFTHVTNVEGSIFKWANENRPLVRGDNVPVTLVDPYNSVWEKLLVPEHRAPLAR